MIRVIVYLLVVGLAAFAAVWFAERPGEVAITWQGWRAETSLMVLMAVVAVISLILVMAWSLLRALIRAPKAVSRYLRNRRELRGFQAVSQGLIAVASGDARGARKLADEASRIAPAEPLTLLLGAQAAQLAGDRASAERTFHVMAGREDTRLLGLHGLYIEAQRRADPAAARLYAEQAAAAARPPAWAAQAALEFRCAAGDWNGALERLERNMNGGLVDKSAYRRQRAVLLTARAFAAEEAGDRGRARALALEAVKLAPTLVPAAALAGALLGQAGELRKAARIIEVAWQANPHPDLADAYAHLRPGDSARQRLTRIEALAAKSPGNIEGALAVARAALDAQEFAIARKTLAPLAIVPTRRVATLMAELEEREHGDIGRARAWVTRALSARRDPAWTADGFVSERWLPVSPVTGRLDALEWKDPLSGFAGAMIEAQSPEALDARAASPLPEPEADVAFRSPPQEEERAERIDRGRAQFDRSERSEPTGRVVTLPPRIDKVIPLVHAPDDPGPNDEPPIEPMAEAAAEPPRDGWQRIRQLFK